MINQIKTYSHKIIIYIYKQKAILLLTLIYGVSVIFISSFHEVWRDEVRALSIVMDSRDIIQLFKNLHNEGHPGLWYLILYFGFKLTRAVVVLKIVSILIAISAIYVFLKRAPFLWIQKILFVFGFFPLYEYSVISRNYGFSMLLLFLFCSLYKERFKNIFLVSIVLFLLANTNAHSLIIVIAIFLSMFIELIHYKAGLIKSNQNLGKIAIGFSIIIIGILFSIVQIYPDKTTIVTGVHFLDFFSVIKAGIKALVFPGRLFSASLGLNNAVFVTLVIWLSYVYLLLRAPFLFIIFFTSLTGLGMFFLLIYGAEMYHQGFLYLLIVAIFWIGSLVNEGGKVTIEPFNMASAFINKHKNTFFSFLLIMQIFMAYPAVKAELFADYSSSKIFGKFLKDHLDLKDAIIIGEPDYLLESIAYYVTNPIYIPREQRFGKTVKLTTDSRRKLSLGELLNIAQKLKDEFNKPIVIATWLNLSPQRPFTLVYSYNKIFTCSPEQLKMFLENTTKIVSFHDAISDENYDVFVLK